MTRRPVARRSAQTFVVLLIFAGIITFIPTASAQSQQSKSSFVAPVPPILQTAKTVFISDGGADPDILDRLSSNPPNLPFNQFYALMQEWGRFQIVTSPSDADLVLEVSVAQFPVNCTGASGTCGQNKVQVSIYDAKSKFRIRSIVESAQSAVTSENFVKNMNTATQRAFRDFQSMTAPPAQ